MMELGKATCFIQSKLILNLWEQKPGELRKDLLPCNPFTTAQTSTPMPPVSCKSHIWDATCIIYLSSCHKQLAQSHFCSAWHQQEMYQVRAECPEGAVPAACIALQQGWPSHPQFKKQEGLVHIPWRIFPWNIISPTWIPHCFRIWWLAAAARDAPACLFGWRVRSLLSWRLCYSSPSVVTMCLN